MLFLKSNNIKCSVCLIVVICVFYCKGIKFYRPLYVIFVLFLFLQNALFYLSILDDLFIQYWLKWALINLVTWCLIDEYRSLKVILFISMILDLCGTRFKIQYLFGNCCTY